jgi:glycosyltransferase involved in cell wall biosynthesis
MNILFLHRNFPAQFRHIAASLAQDPKNKVVFITNRKEYNIPGVAKYVYSLKREVAKETHRYLRFYEDSVLHAQGAAEAALQLKSQGFVPDVIYGHSWGPNMFMKDIFPNAALLVYFEWFYNAHDSDVDFVNPNSISINTEANIRVKNSHILVDLYTCDHGISPTIWQHDQFPKEYKDKISIIHDGIQTDICKPEPNSKLIIPRINLDLSEAKEIVTYVGRGMEPYRGFPQFMESIELILKERPNCHVVIVGEDRVCYGSQLPDNQTYKKLMLERLDLDMTRVHFTGHLLYPEYLNVLQSSKAHVYLTYPFVLSWSLLEAMSTGCIIVGSATQPVKEVIKEGFNGYLTDFFSPVKISKKVMEVLDLSDNERNQISQNARQTIVDEYDLNKLLPKQIDLLRGLRNSP